MTSPRIITLTTDFGLRDAYVAVMKAVILEIIPDVTIIDISHQVSPQNVPQAAYLLQTAYRYFPPDAVHVAVVDPGVGTERKPVAVSTSHGVFVGPDNGVLSAVLTDQDILETADGMLRGGEAVELTNERYRRHPVSRTFHGRDIFAPAAAHIAGGMRLSELGHPLVRLHGGESTMPRREGNQVRGAIIHVDRFGNAVSNVPADMVPESPVFEVSGHTVDGISSSYQEAQLVAILGSTGLVEIAVRNGSAADRLGVAVGDPLLVRSAD